jgi:hypothetical protein
MILKRQKITTPKGDILGHLQQPKQIPEALALKESQKSLPMNTIFKSNFSNNQLSDREGLKIAYEQGNHIYINNNKMFIAGSKSFQDWRDNLLIPPTLTTYHNIYQSAHDELTKNAQVNEIIGHSAGGAVVLELEKQYPNRFNKTRTYSAPVFSPLGYERLDQNHLRFRTQNDPIAVLDNSAITINKNTINPFVNHSYENYGDMGKDTGVQII